MQLCALFVHQSECMDIASLISPLCSIYTHSLMPGDAARTSICFCSRLREEAALLVLPVVFLALPLLVAAADSFRPFEAAASAAA